MNVESLIEWITMKLLICILSLNYFIVRSKHFCIKDGRLYHYKLTFGKFTNFKVLEQTSLQCTKGRSVGDCYDTG